MSEPKPTAPCCRRVIYEGRVQGVGFRFTAASAARAYQISGYVRNCADGTVELVAAGTFDHVEQLLRSIGESFSGNIERQTVEELEYPERFDSFEIRR
jgi:acylphosphatase